MRFRSLAIASVSAALVVAGCTTPSTTSGPPASSDTSSSSSPPGQPTPGQPTTGQPTRSGPEATGPTSLPRGKRRTTAADATGWGPTRGELRQARTVVAEMSDRELAGQVIMARYDGTAAPTALVDEFHLGGVIVMSENVASPGAIIASNRSLTHSVDRPWPLAIGVDQEGGLVARIGAPMTQFPTYMSLGAAADPALATQVAKASGQELRAAGFTVVFAPDADVTIGPADPTIGSRSAGDRPRLVARIVTASTRGYLRSGIVPVLKHFPGHGSVTANSHETLPHQGASLRALRSRDFVPFDAAIGAGAPAVMVAHLSLDHVDPGVPSDLSSADIGLLASDLGFRGLVTTDALEMGAVTQQYGAAEAAVTALQAGADLLVMPADTATAYRGIVAALATGRLTRARVEGAAAKIGALMLHQESADTASASSIGSHRRLAQLESTAAITVVRGSCRGPYVDGAVSPVGDPAYVQAFSAAATAGGLDVGSGTTVGLSDSGAMAQAVDVAVSVTTPYGLASGGGAPTRLAAFGWSPQAMRALVGVLTGARAPGGSLPVRVDGLTAPCADSH